MAAQAGKRAQSQERKYEKAIVALLVAASIICCGLIGVRMWRTGTVHYGFLVWNLGLAWVPFLAAAAAYAAAFTGRRATYSIIIACALVWLLFFPNAPYILTDFLHLGETEDSAPVWYDMTLLIWFSWTGLMLGVLSLNLMHQIVRRSMGRTVGWSFVLVATALGSIGIYLGRFLRWNSWDVFHNPRSMTYQIIDRARDPLSNNGLFAFSLLFGLLFLFVYLVLHAFGGLTHARLRRAEDARE